MAETPAYPPSERRLRDARDAGFVPRASFAVTALGVAVAAIVGAFTLPKLAAGHARALDYVLSGRGEARGVLGELERMRGALLVLVAIAVLVSLALQVAVAIVVRGKQFSARSAVSRPLPFSVRASFGSRLRPWLVGLCAAAFGLLAVWLHVQSAVMLASVELGAWGRWIASLGGVLALVLTLFAALDAVWEWLAHRASLSMTRREWLEAARAEAQPEAVQKALARERARMGQP